MSANQCHRLPSETEEERAVRLQRMSANQCHRLATETEEERAARLQRMRDRLASETEEERAARLSRATTLRGNVRFQCFGCTRPPTHRLVPLHLACTFSSTTAVYLRLNAQNSLR